MGARLFTRGPWPLLAPSKPPLMNCVRISIMRKCFLVVFFALHVTLKIYPVFAPNNCVSYLVKYDKKEVQNNFLTFFELK